MPVSAPHIVPPCQEDLALIYRDNWLLVINKPEPMLSTPGRLPENRDSAIGRLQLDYPSASLVHRLDMATSGLMVIALSKPVHRHLSMQFQQRQVTKSYQAIVQGQPTQDSGEISLPLITDWEHRPRQKVCFASGKPSLTRYQVLERLPDGNSRVRFMPVTGRSHQLRVHSCEIGHPILGCQLYYQGDSQRQSHRLMLHAETLGFYHPQHQGWMSFRSPVPF
ncbi:MAG TPA: pseudouridine synthase [Pseudomonadales bacterium]